MTSRSGAGGANVSASSAVGTESGSSLRRVSSARRAFSSGVKRRSVCAQVKLQMVRNHHPSFIVYYTAAAVWRKVVYHGCGTEYGRHWLHRVEDFYTAVN